MQTQMTIEEVRQAELDILKYIDDICREHDIPYFLDYGTLLGAIRHKGFIPWDDDIDICMKRVDYERFIKIVASYPVSRFRFLSDEMTPDYYYEYGKMVDTRTILVETGVRKSSSMGVWVDVFPKDNLPANHKILRCLVFISVSMRIFSVYERFPKHYSMIYYPVWLFARLFGHNFFLKLTKYLQKYSNISKNVKYVGDLRDRTAKTYCWPLDMFDASVMVDFEGRKYPAPQKWDQYLKGLYDDYMTLPPEDKRLVHSFDVFWK